MPRGWKCFYSNTHKLKAVCAQKVEKSSKSINSSEFKKAEGFQTYDSYF